jgi:hypothetical protein
MKFSDEELSRVLSAVAEGRLHENTAAPTEKTLGCLVQVAINTSEAFYRESIRDAMAASWFDYQGGRPMARAGDPDAFLSALEERGFA